MPAGWWFRPEFIINELNINSVITSPCHEETLTLGSSLDYTIQGYAYTGVSRACLWLASCILFSCRCPGKLARRLCCQLSSSTAHAAAASASAPFNCSTA